MGGGNTSGTQNANGQVYFAPQSMDGGNIMIGGSVGNADVHQGSQHSASGAGVDLKLDMPMPMPALQNLIRASEISKGISDAKGIYDQIKGFRLQNLDQEEDLQNLIRASEISKGISDAKGIYDQIKGFKLQNLKGINADKIEKTLTDLTTIINDARDLKDALRDFGKLQNLDQNTELQMIGLVDPDLQNLGWGQDLRW